MTEDPYTYIPSPTIRAIDELAETLRNRVGPLKDFLRVAQGGPQQWVAEPREKLSAQGMHAVRRYYDQLGE